MSHLAIFPAPRFLKTLAQTATIRLNAAEFLTGSESIARVSAKLSTLDPMLDIVRAESTIYPFVDISLSGGTEGMKSLVSVEFVTSTGEPLSFTFEITASDTLPESSFPQYPNIYQVGDIQRSSNHTHLQSDITNLVIPTFVGNPIETGSYGTASLEVDPNGGTPIVIDIGTDDKTAYYNNLVITLHEGTATETHPLLIAVDIDALTVDITFPYDAETPAHPVVTLGALVGAINAQVDLDGILSASVLEANAALEYAGTAVDGKTATLSGGFINPITVAAPESGAAMCFDPDTENLYVYNPVSQTWVTFAKFTKA